MPRPETSLPRQLEQRRRPVTAHLLVASCACLTLSVAAAAPQKPTTYSFAAGPYYFEMAIAFPEPYAGRRLVFYNSSNPQVPVCYAGDGASGNCLERFVGAVALVQYSARRADGQPVGLVTIREIVRVLDQSKELPDRREFSKTVELVRGEASDLQVFGYDESELGKSERLSTRRRASQTLWRLYRQELYLDSETAPFAIIEWQHTLNHIKILRIYSPPVRQ